MKNAIFALLAMAAISFSCQKTEPFTPQAQVPELSRVPDTIYRATFLPNKWSGTKLDCINEKGDCFDEVEVRTIPSDQRDLLAAMLTMEPAQVAEVFANNRLSAFADFARPEFEDILQYLSAQGAVVEKVLAQNTDFYKFSSTEGTLLFVIPVVND
ncbi:hypothetical protein [Schleiferia thermophila]|uniref:hypothetical protein n=1 Tax=Schleiferia thermophila TaxID=884107 RepID=UPI002FDA61B0